MTNDKYRAFLEGSVEIGYLSCVICHPEYLTLLAERTL
jgi:hypothetical protein